MPAYKNQHFLAQRAMRKFGHADGRSIDLYNLRKRSVIYGASISDQCSKPYFYMKNGDMEPAFAQVENRGLSVFDQIESKGHLPSVNTPTHHDLIRYISFQEGRTLGAVQEVQDSQEAVAKLFLESSLKAKGDPDNLLPHLPDLKINFLNIPMENVFRSVVCSPLLQDLSLCVFESSPAQDFILGDDPVILTNAFLVVNDKPVCGLATRGLIIICPIAPTHALVLYDGETYQVKPYRLSKKETLELNIAEASCAYANFYFAEFSKVQDTCAASLSFPRLQINSSTSLDGRETLIHSIKPAVTLGNKLLRRFVVRKNAKLHRFKIGDTTVRNPSMADLIRSIRTPKDLANFMKERSTGSSVAR